MDEILQYFNGRDQLSTIILAVMAVFIGKLLEKLLSRKLDNLNEHLTLRKELREELNALHNEVKLLRVDVDEWRAKYWEQIQINTRHQATILALQGELSDVRGLLDEYKVTNTELSHKLDSLTSPGTLEIQYVGMIPTYVSSSTDTLSDTPP